MEKTPVISSMAVNYISTSQIYEIIKGDLGKRMHIQLLHKTLANQLQHERNWNTECRLFCYTYWTEIRLNYSETPDQLYS